MSTGDYSPSSQAIHFPGSAPPAPLTSCGTPHRNIGDGERVISLVSGGALAGLGVAKGGLWGLGLVAIGGGLFYRGMTGHCTAYQVLGVTTVPQSKGVRPNHGVRVTKSLSINRSPGEVSRVWGQLPNLPKIMRHLESVEQLPGNRSHWVAKAMGMKFEWDAETTSFVEGEEIRWRSLPGGDIDTEGVVRFKDDGRGGTLLEVEMSYDPPAGAVGDKLAGLVGGDLESQISEDLRRFRAQLETGEVPKAAALKK